MFAGGTIDCRGFKVAIAIMQVLTRHLVAEEKQLQPSGTEEGSLC